MSLENYQLVLAKLYTDQSFREKFYQNPQKMAALHNLDEATALSLVQNHQKPIDFFSQSLINKRWNIVKNFLSKTQEILSAEVIFQHFQNYANTQTLKHEDRYAQDAFDFGKYLLASLSLKKKEKECLLFEMYHIRLEKPYFRWKIFYYPIIKVFTKNETLSSLKFRPNLLIQIHWRKQVWRYHF